MTDLVVASWNVWRENTLPHVKAGVQVCIDAGADVIGLQEMSDDSIWLAVTAWLKGKGWQGIRWNNATPLFVGPDWQLLDSGNEVVSRGGDPLEDGTGGDRSGYKAVTWVDVKHRKTGARAFVANNHLLPAIESAGKLATNRPKRQAFKQRQLDALAAVLAPHVKAGVLCAATGDLNLDWPKAGQSLKPWLKANKLNACWTSSKERGTHGARTIDYVLHTNRCTRVKILPRHNSDHNPVVASLTSAPVDKEDDPMAASWDGTGAITSATRQRMGEILAAGKKAGITVYQTWGKVSDPGNTEHYTGRAVDFMIFDSAAKKGTDRGIGDWLAEYLWTNRVRLGVKWIIWRDRIRSTSPGHSGEWVARGKGDHYDHVHVLFDTSAYRPPAAVKPLPVYLVDPAKVSTKLTGISPSSALKDLLQPPGFRITNGVQLQTVGTRRFLVTSDGYRYDLAFLKLEGTVPPPVEQYPNPSTDTVYLDRLTHGVLDSDSVHILQQALVKILGDDAKISPTGDYGDGTAAAVKAWKAKNLTASLNRTELAALLKQAGITKKIEDKS